MRICLVTPTYPRGGASSGVATIVRALAHGLIQAGHEAVVVSLSPKVRDSENDRGVIIHWVCHGQYHWYMHKVPGFGELLSLPVRELEYSLALWRRVRDLHEQEPFDIIEGTETGSVFLSWLRGQSRIVLRLHGEEFTFQQYAPGMSVSPAQHLSRRLQRLPLLRAHSLVSPSYAHAHEISRELGHHSPPINVIPHGLDSMWTELDVQHRKATRDSVVLFLGRIERMKGILDLFTAFARVIQICPKARLIVAGGSHPSIAKFEVVQKLRELSLTTSVDFLGQLSYAQLVDLYPQAQVVVIPSYYETFGLVALEAMAHALPVIGYRAGGVPEVVVDSETGLLVPPGDVQALAEAIIRLLTNSPLRKQMGLAGRARAEQEFSLDRFVSKNLELYQTIARTATIPHLGI